MTTAAEFASLLAEHRTAYEALKATEGDLEREKYDQEGARYRQAFAAVLEARPTEPATLALQLCWFLEEVGTETDSEPMLRHIAERLEAMAATA
jgi:hypothetical protein